MNIIEFLLLLILFSLPFTCCLISILFDVNLILLFSLLLLFVSLINLFITILIEKENFKK